MIERAIHLSCPKNGTVLDPMAGSGITGIVAERMNRNYILIDIDGEKVVSMRDRLNINKQS